MLKSLKNIDNKEDPRMVSSSKPRTRTSKFTSAVERKSTPFFSIALQPSLALAGQATRTQ